MWTILNVLAGASWGIMRTLFLLCSILISAAGLVNAQVVPTQQESQQAYLIGPGDEITTKILGEPQFDFVATVDQDGKIEVPFFDKPIVATCRTERELRADVSKLSVKVFEKSASQSSCNTA